VARQEVKQRSQNGLMKCKWSTGSLGTSMSMSMPISVSVEEEPAT